jgi:carbamate kinase
MRLLIALGGNAIKQAHEAGTAEEQWRNCLLTMKQLAIVVSRMEPEDRLVITHGNGPQAGNLLVQQEAGKSAVPAQTMDIVGAMTQGQIGYMLQQTLQNSLAEMGLRVPVAAVVNQVLVDKDDREFSSDTASKPVGNFFTEDQARALKAEHPEYVMKRVRPNTKNGWRRTVPSPDPISNIEQDAIRRMVESGIIVIASGGGGIPVIEDAGCLRGVEAVIDKDLAGERLAEVVNADTFMILTDIDKVRLNYGKQGERGLSHMTVPEAKEYMKQGHFLPGSMGPKVMACIRFVEGGGRRAVISSLDNVSEAIEGRAGTEISQVAFNARGRAARPAG